MNQRDAIRKATTEATKMLIDEGRIIEAGWAGVSLMFKNASPEEKEKLRDAFLMGADHLFSSIMVMLDPEKEPTPQDEARMESIGLEMLTVGEYLREKFIVE